jgi:hypothetical protein
LINLILIVNKMKVIKPIKITLDLRVLGF